ncbi:uncharacterized protein [Leptinotarsa decemlineata]|uniref:uncharacterized protein n=1 Tax=Leptinotarsa decemlineata TaxID=7539 RepID=UPI000C251C10|nr:uncharacterized protein LOC111505272 [Leptinotarsa decemlineata]
MEIDEMTTEQNLIREQRELELQFATVKKKLQDIEDKMKREMQKKMYCQANIDELMRNTEYYSNAAVKIRRRLKNTRSVLSQFIMAANCYEKLLSDCSEMYFFDEPETEMESKFNTTESPTDLQQQIGDIQRQISEYSEEIDKLFNSLQISSTDAPLSENNK